MATIHFAGDAIRPVRTNGSAGGANSTRSNSHNSDEPGKSGKISVVDGVDEEVALKHEGDVKHKQVFSGSYLFWLAYQATGVIYGDIGTSPLYVYSSTFTSNPSYDDLVGVLSIIIWTLTLMVTVKYVCIVLRADDEGEGGTFAVYSLLSRYANITKRDPKEESMVEIKRYATNDMKRPNRSIRSGIEHSLMVRTILKVVGVLGVALIMSDGVLTPAQSILGAIQGLQVVNPNITTSTIVGASCGILVLLFLVQPLGITKIASAFAPIVIIWLLFNFTFGIYNLVVFDHTVLKAFSPYFAGAYFVRNGTDGWKSLGGILLAFTGVEALFADLGAFSMRAIQLSWLGFAYPCLLLAYIGQAAYISANPAAFAYPFFDCVPPGMLYPSLVIAVLAAIVASQAMITSTFQLLSQIMKLSYFPQIKLVHTSKIFHGQIYIPFANWLLMIGTIIVTAVYNNTNSLGNAYGVCVILVTFITTCMVSLVALIIWRLNPFIVLVGFLVFGSLDAAYLSAVFIKVPQGAWFTLVLACFLSSIFILWRYGKENQWRAEASDRFHPSHIVTRAGDNKLVLTPVFGGGEITHIKGFGIFFDKAGDMTPTVFIEFLRKFIATPDVSVFFHLRPLSTPHIPPENRYTVLRTVIPNCYRLIIRHGYTDEIITEDLGRMIYNEIRSFILSSPSTLGPSDPSNPNPESLASSSSSEKDAGIETAVGEKLKALEKAYETQVIYIVGKEQMRIKSGTGIARTIALNAFLWLRENTRSKIAAMKIPTDKLVEVGFVKEV